jgi:hypothetical protein
MDNTDTLMASPGPESDYEYSDEGDEQDDEQLSSASNVSDDDTDDEAPRNGVRLSGKASKSLGIDFLDPDLYGLRRSGRARAPAGKMVSLFMALLIFIA